MTTAETKSHYRVIDGWGVLPEGVVLGEVAGVAVDHQDHVYAFSRGPNPVVVFDREGHLLRTWGEGFFARPHGISIGPGGMIYCVDEGTHSLSVHKADGELVLDVGRRGREPSPFHTGTPFHRCTHAAVGPDGCVYVSDGYGNARVHKYSPSGTHLLSWGQSGAAVGEFNLPHNIACDPDGLVFVADRENHRVQVFDENGKFEYEIRGLHRPSALHLTPGGDLLVGELGPTMRFNRGAPNLGPRVSILDRSGAILDRIEGHPAAGLSAEQFVAPHGIASDSRGDLYVAEVSTTGWPELFPEEPLPAQLPSLRKFTLLGTP